MKDGKYEVQDGQLVKSTTGEPIPYDEPIFILRGRDNLAVKTLEVYAMLSETADCTDYHVRGVAEAVERFRKFREEHPERMKQPGITRGM